ncbi:phage tail protein [Pectobacterium colocasium]|uniref:phage tail protein n=1 Tax=Pectobacterium TaxID=122277 RepID=UPI003D72D0B5
MWGTPVPPDGWLELNGQLFNPSGNPILASLYPSGQVPDFRGYFPRGWDNGAGIDPDSRAILSIQGDAIQNITGKFPSMTWSRGLASDEFFVGAFKNDRFIGPGDRGTDETTTFQASFDASLVVPTAEENRPKNISVMFIIKAG